MEIAKIENVKFFNLRKLAEAKREVGEDAPLQDLLKAYEKRAGLYEVGEVKKTPQKKAVKKAAKKTKKNVAKKTKK